MIARDGNPLFATLFKIPLTDLDLDPLAQRCQKALRTGFNRAAGI
jgi:hypothetical protein